MRSSKFLLTLGTALLPILMASAASAQTTSEEQDSGDEIIVTGTRTGALDLQQAPVAVSVLDSELLETQGLNNLQDMATYIPNFTFARNPQSAVAYIRGVGSSNTQAGSDASVTMQVDGVYIARASGQLTDLFDVERIEVLRGPQGTLYGRNSAGGTINVISRQPSTEFSGRARFTYGNFDTIEGEGYLTGPLAGDALSGSLALTYRSHDAFFDNVVVGGTDVGDANRGGGRLQVRWEPTSNIDATTRIDYLSSHEHPTSYNHLLAPVPVAAPIANSLVGSLDDTAINSEQLYVSQLGGISEAINWRINDRFTLGSITAWRSTRVKLENDNDATEINALLLRIWEDDDQFSQELTLNYTGEHLRAIAGLYYFEDSNDQTNFLTVTPSVFPPPPPPGYTTAISTIDTTSTAIFGQLEYEFAPDLTLVLGARYSEDTKHFDQDFRRTNLALVPAPGFPVVFQLDRTDDAFAPRIGLNYQMTPDVFLYASATQGYKSGGFNNGATAPATAGFNPEEVTAYEVGARTEWMDGRLRLNATGFHYDYTDLQVRQLLGPGNAIITNAASAKVDGIEIEAVISPTDDLRFSGNVSWLDATYESFPTAAAPGGYTVFLPPAPTCVAGICNASGNRLDGAPEWSGMVAVDYSPTIGSYEINAHMDYGWRSRAFFDATNVPISSQEAYGLLNASLGFGPGEGWQVELFARNITDEQYAQAISGNGPRPGAVVGDPRTYGVRIGYEW